MVEFAVAVLGLFETHWAGLAGIGNLSLSCVEESGKLNPC